MGSTGCVTWVGRAWNKEKSLKTVSLQVLGLLYLNSPPENQGTVTRIAQDMAKQAP